MNIISAVLCESALTGFSYWLNIFYCLIYKLISSRWWNCSESVLNQNLYNLKAVTERYYWPIIADSRHVLESCKIPRLYFRVECSQKALFANFCPHLLFTPTHCCNRVRDSIGHGKRGRTATPQKPKYLSWLIDWSTLISTKRNKSFIYIIPVKSRYLTYLSYLPSSWSAIVVFNSSGICDYFSLSYIIVVSWVPKVTFLKISIDVSSFNSCCTKEALLD